MGAEAGKEVQGVHLGPTSRARVSQTAEVGKDVLAVEQPGEAVLSYHRLHKIRDWELFSHRCVPSILPRVRHIGSTQRLLAE